MIVSTDLNSNVTENPYRFTGLKKIFYSSKDLKVFRFCFKIDSNVKDTITHLNLLRPRIKRRGCRAGKNKGLVNRDNHKHIRRIDNIIRSEKHLKVTRRSVCNSNLITIDREIKKYLYPNIILANCRSLRNKFDELYITIANLDPDLAILTETWLTESDMNAYDIDGFSVMHRVRNRDDKCHGGGISVYVRDGISVLSVKYPECAELEIISILIRTSNMQREIPFIAVIAVYSPPVNKFAEKNIDYILSEIDRIRSINIQANIMVIGDFNDLNIDSRLKEPNFKQLITQQTCNVNLIDKCFYSGNIKYNVTIAAPISTSDHKLIRLSPDNYVKRGVKYTYSNSRPRKNSSYRSMWSALNSTQWETVIENENFDTAVESFHSLVSLLYDKHFPIVKTKFKKNNKSWFNNKIKKAIEKRNLHYKNNQIEQLHNINKEIKSLIKEAKHKEYIKFDKMIANGSMSFYDVVKSYNNSDSQCREIIFPGMDIDSSIEMTSSYYSGILNKHSPLDLKLLPTYLPGLPIKPVTDLYVYNQLKSVKDNLSSAPDGIPNFILREYAFELTPPITYLMNRSLEMGYCPRLWKCNYLITIPKKRIISTPSDLRPIVLSSAVIKILERYIYGQLLPELIDKIDSRQFGGLPGKSAENYLTFYLDTVLKNLDILGNRVTTIITDYSKAFDAVDHNLFMCNLLSMAPPPSICKWLSSFLDKRTLQMKWNNTPTDKYFLCSNGAPQGSVLGGLVFSIVINEVAVDWEHRLKYVDDLTVLCVQSDKDDSTIPQRIVESLIKDSNDTKMSLNLSKCQYMTHCFSKNPASFDLAIGSDTLSKVSQCKIIGVIIQENLKWDAHIESVIANANKKFFLLYRLKNVGMCSSLLTKAYYTYIRPSLEYCCVIWTKSISKAQSLELEKIQKRAVRLILGRGYINYDNALMKLGLDSLVDRRTKLFNKYATKFLSSFPEFMPATRFSASGINTRSALNLCAPKCRTSRYRMSPIPCIIDAVNQAC